VFIVEEQEQKNVISKIYPESKAQKLGIEQGDKLLKINNEYIEDIIEYMFLIADEYLEIEIEKKDGVVIK
jgi:NifB/MoaA-like Fe-S oxidoreductase